MSNGSGFVKETAMDERFDREEETRVKIFSDEKTGEDLNEDDIIYGIDEENPSEAGAYYDDPEDDDDFDEEEEKKERLTCPVCGKEINFFTKKRVVRGLYICGDCEDKSAIDRHKKEIKKYSPEEALKTVVYRIRKAEEFTVTKSADGYLLLDNGRELWTVPYAATLIKNTPKIDPEHIFPFDAIESYELIEDGNLLAKGGRNKPLIGGLLFGNEGAGFSGNSEDHDTVEHLQVRINLNDMTTPKVFINLIFKETDKDKRAYGRAFLTAQKILSMLEIICHQDDRQEEDAKKTSSSDYSPADEIKKYKELLDMGAITQEEYDAKKAKLLDL